MSRYHVSFCRSDIWEAFRWCSVWGSLVRLQSRPGLGLAEPLPGRLPPMAVGPSCSAHGFLQSILTVWPMAFPCLREMKMEASAPFITWSWKRRTITSAVFCWSHRRTVATCEDQEVGTTEAILNAGYHSGYGFMPISFLRRREVGADSRKLLYDYSQYA